mgnify:CR=1 FL=1
MPRLFRATLPDGQRISICPDSRSTADETDLAAEGTRLASMLGSEEPEDVLLSFLGNVCPAVFPEADPAGTVRRMHGSVERGIDLAFALRNRSEIGVVQISKPRRNDRPPVLSSLKQIEHLLNGTSFLEPVRTVYLIAGRGLVAPQMAARASELQNETKIPIHVLSWDDVVQRLIVGKGEERESGITIVLVEVIDFARRLLRRLAVNPGLIRAIDDRKFEELVATLLSDLGFQDVELTSLRKDGGKDIIATHIGADRRRSRYLIECKHWVSGNKVTMRWAIHLLSVTRTDQADAAVLLSTSGFGPKLIEQEASLMKDGLFLRGADHLARWTSLWERQYGAMLLQPVDPRELLELAT